MCVIRISPSGDSIIDSSHQNGSNVNQYLSRTRISNFAFLVSSVKPAYAIFF